MTPRARPGRAGFSNITSTVILTSVLLSIMIVASYLSNDVLTTQIAASEFKTAEDLTKTIDSEIRKLMFKPGSSSIIKVSFSTTAPGFTKTGQNMIITFTGQSPCPIEANQLNIEGRQQIGGSFNYTLQGDSSLIIWPYNGSLGRICISKPLNWRVSLDYERALCTFTGIVNLYDGAVYTPQNTVEVTAIALDFGDFTVTANSLILIQNERVETKTFTLTGNWNAIVSLPGIPNKTVSLVDMGGKENYKSLVNFHTIYIKISVLEGG